MGPVRGSARHRAVLVLPESESRCFRIHPLPAEGSGKK
jgi:hypothetical protein